MASLGVSPSLSLGTVAGRCVYLRVLARAFRRTVQWPRGHGPVRPAHETLARVNGCGCGDGITLHKQQTHLSPSSMCVSRQITTSLHATTVVRIRSPTRFYALFSGRKKNKLLYRFRTARAQRLQSVIITIIKSSSRRVQVVRHRFPKYKGPRTHRNRLCELEGGRHVTVSPSSLELFFLASLGGPILFVR